MAAEKWPEPDNREKFEPYPNTNSSYNQPYASQEIIEPARPESGGFKDNLREWGTGFAKDQARDYALGKAAGLAAKTALGARVFGVTRWFFIAEWGSLAVAALFVRGAGYYRPFPARHHFKLLYTDSGSHCLRSLLGGAKNPAVCRTANRQGFWQVPGTGQAGDGPFGRMARMVPPQQAAGLRLLLQGR
jgi:hypothetical protein